MSTYPLQVMVDLIEKMPIHEKAATLQYLCNRYNIHPDSSKLVKKELNENLIKYRQRPLKWGNAGKIKAFETVLRLIK